MSFWQRLNPFHKSGAFDPQGITQWYNVNTGEWLDITSSRIHHMHYAFAHQDKFGISMAEMKHPEHPYNEEVAAKVYPQGWVRVLRSTYKLQWSIQHDDLVAIRKTVEYLFTHTGCTSFVIDYGVAQPAPLHFFLSNVEQINAFIKKGAIMGIPNTTT